MTPDERSFSAVWGAGFVRQEHKTVGVGFFRTAGGYEDHDVAAIEALEVGEVLDLSDGYCVHSVQRLT